MTAEIAAVEPEVELTELPEYVYYEKAQEQSHPAALQDSLLYLMDTDKRTESQDYIAERAQLEGAIGAHP